MSTAVTDAPPALCCGNHGQCDAVATIYVWSTYAAPTGSRYNTILGPAALSAIERNPLGARCIDCAIDDLQLAGELQRARADKT